MTSPVEPALRALKEHLVVLGEFVTALLAVVYPQRAFPSSSCQGWKNNNRSASLDASLGKSASSLSIWFHRGRALSTNLAELRRRTSLSTGGLELVVDYGRAGGESAAKQEWTAAACASTRSEPSRYLPHRDGSLCFGLHSRASLASRVWLANAQVTLIYAPEGGGSVS